MDKIMLCMGIIVLVSGCASTDPYIDIGIGKRIDRLSDELLRSDRDYTCNSLTAELAAGLEGELSPRMTGYCELYHWSHWLCGSNGNGKPELYEMRLRCNARYRFGRR